MWEVPTASRLEGSACELLVAKVGEDGGNTCLGAAWEELGWSSARAIMIGFMGALSFIGVAVPGAAL